MSLESGEFWASIPEKALHPRRVSVLEAIRTLDEPLSAIDLVNLFDGADLTMWEAAHHLQILDALDVVEPDPDSRDPLARRDAFDLPYRLTISGATA